MRSSPLPVLILLLAIAGCTADESRPPNTLSVRNTDAAGAVTLTAVRYYDDTGAIVRSYLSDPLRLGPLASTDFIVAQEDDTGGLGANFIAEWQSDRPVAPPVVEAVMISASSSQGISFVTQGRVVDRLAAPQ